MTLFMKEDAHIPDIAHGCVYASYHSSLNKIQIVY